MVDSTFITRVMLKNYKSIAACDVRLRSLVFLVGPNGSGKSNFLDALRFVTDSLNTSLDHALRDRGGIKEVRRRSGGHPTHFGIRLEFRLRDDAVGSYSFQVGARPQGGYEVQTEECRVRAATPLTEEVFYSVREGKVEATSMKVAPVAASDRLYLVNASGLPEFRPLYEAWFLADVESIRGHRGLNDDIVSPEQPESIRGAKEWLSNRMKSNRRYQEVLDQPALTSIINLQAAQKSDSFNKCYREIVRLLTRLKAMDRSP